MRVLRTFTKRVVTRTLSCAMALMTILALMVATNGPVLSVAAQDEGSPDVPAVYRPVYDFTGDSRTDFANVINVNLGSPITWKILRNPADPAPNQAFIRQFTFGTVGDAIVAHTFSGNTKTEIAVWRTGNFYIGLFPESTAPMAPPTVVNWGNPSGENLSRDGDYDGDGIVDPTVVRLIGGFLSWHYRGSTSGPRSINFGQTVAGRSTLAYKGADFTGDGRDEFVFCTASTSTGQNTYWIGDSVTGAVVFAGSWGNFITDYFVQPDDYTGDGIADLIAFRAGGAGADAAGWFIRNTATGTLVPPVIFGVADPTFLDNDQPIRGNYDGDSRADIGVWRQSTATYYWINSSNGSIGGQQWGDPALTADFSEFPLAITFSF